MKGHLKILTRNAVCAGKTTCKHLRKITGRMCELQKLPARVLFSIQRQMRRFR
jgi:hypothetical protein